MSNDPRNWLTRRRVRSVTLAAKLTFCSVVSAAGQYPSPSVAVSQSALTGSVPSGPSRNEVLRLTLRDAITRALRYNLAPIESGENARIARGQRLLALSKLLPQVSAGASENVEQISLATFGLQHLQGVPNVVGPFSYSSVDLIKKEIKPC